MDIYAPYLPQVDVVESVSGEIDFATRRVLTHDKALHTVTLSFHI